MGLNDIVDEVQIAGLLWQRSDGTKGTKKQERIEEEVILKGKAIDEDTFHSRKTGAPVSAPDTLFPEREK